MAFRVCLTRGLHKLGVLFQPNRLWHSVNHSSLRVSCSPRAHPAPSHLPWSQGQQHGQGCRAGPLRPLEPCPALHSSFLLSSSCLKQPASQSQQISSYTINEGFYVHSNNPIKCLPISTPSAHGWGVCNITHSSSLNTSRSNTP